MAYSNFGAQFQSFVIRVANSIKELVTKTDTLTSNITTLNTNVVKTINNNKPTNGNITPAQTGCLPLGGGDITGNLTVQGKNVIRSINGSVADVNGNMVILLSKSDVTSALGYTPLQTAPVTSVNGQTGAVTIATSDSTKIPLSGSRGTLAGYNIPTSSSTAITINASSNDDTIVTAAVAVTVNDGSSGQTWTKTVALQNASATVTLGGSWKWVGGSAPTIKANSILVVKWCGSFGLANLIAGE